MKYNEMIDKGFYEDELYRIRDTYGKLYHNEKGKIEYLEQVNPNNVWGQIIDLKSKDTRHKGVANNLTKDELDTILATLEFFGVDNLNLVFFDLKGARYRVFDWLAMAVQGRIQNKEAVKVLAYSFLKVEGDIDRWIQDLRETDYDVNHSYQKLQI
jgi:hypothetical protein